jgi:hypothetical protein
MKRPARGCQRDAPRALHRLCPVVDALKEIGLDYSLSEQFAFFGAKPAPITEKNLVLALVLSTIPEPFTRAEFLKTAKSFKFDVPKAAKPAPAAPAKKPAKKAKRR